MPKLALKCLIKLQFFMCCSCRCGALPTEAFINCNSAPWPHVHHVNFPVPRNAPFRNHPRSDCGLRSGLPRIALRARASAFALPTQRRSPVACIPNSRCPRSYIPLAPIVAWWLRNTPGGIATPGHFSGSPASVRRTRAGSVGMVRIFFTTLSVSSRNAIVF